MKPFTSLMNTPRRAAVWGFLVLWLGGGAHAFSASDPKLPDVDNVPSAVSMLKLQQSVERGLLESYLTRYHAARQNESLIEETWSGALGDLDALLQNKLNAENQAALQALFGKVKTLRSERETIAREAERLLALLSAQRTRLLALSSAIRDLRQSSPTPGMNVTGRWLVTLMPIKLSGEMRLFQNGVLVSGRYRLSGGWEGSLNGYVAGNKLILERYDASLGRAGQFIAVLSGDGSSISGSWNNYDLSVGPSTGAFTAKKLDR